MVNVEFAHILRRKINVSSHRDIELKHLILLELNGSLYQLPTIDSHVDLVEHRSNDLFAADVGQVSQGPHRVLWVKDCIQFNTN